MKSTRIPNLETCHGHSRIPNVVLNRIRTNDEAYRQDNCSAEAIIRIARFTKITNSTKSALLTMGGIVALSFYFHRAASGTSLAFVTMWVRESPVLASLVEKGKEQNLERNPTMTCRIDRIVIGPGLLTLHISGQIIGKDVDLLRSLLEQERSAVAVDLRNVLLVGREAIRLLALSELNGTELRNCPAYIREWVTRERAVINASEQGIEPGEDTEGA